MVHVIRWENPKMKPRAILVWTFLFVVSVSGEKQTGGIWQSVKDAVSKGKETLTGYFESDEQRCSGDEDGEACVAEEDDTAPGHTEDEDMAEKVQKEKNRNKEIIRSNPLSYYWSQFSEGAGKIYEGMKNKVSTSIGEIYESVQGAVRTVVYDELGKLYDVLMPSLSTPGHILLTTINVLPEEVQTLILICVCLLLAVVMARFVSILFSVGVSMAAFLYFKLFGPYRTLEGGVRTVELMVTVISYSIYYPKPAAALILCLILGTVLYPLYSWWLAYRLRQRQYRMYHLVQDTHCRVLALEERQMEMLRMLKEITDTHDSV